MPLISQYFGHFAEYGKRRVPEIAGLLVLLSVVATALCVLEYREQTGAVQHTLEVKNALAQLLSTLQDAETGQRGFLLTGDEAFLQPYTSGVAITPGHLDLVRRLTADNAAQQARISKIDNLVAKKL